VKPVEILLRSQQSLMMKRFQGPRGKARVSHLKKAGNNS